MPSLGARPWIVGLQVATLLACSGCSFNSSGQGSGTSTQTETSTTGAETSTTQTETSTTQTETTETETTDPGTSETSTTEPPLEDLPPEVCAIDEAAPLEITLSNLEVFSECPPQFLSFVLIAPGDNALAVSLCPGSCNNCEDAENSELSIGPLDINEYVKPAEPFACYALEIEGLLEDDGTQCSYAAVALAPIDRGNELPTFAATRDNWGLPATTWELFGGWQPELQVNQSCDCDEVEGEYCCDQGGVDTYLFSIEGEVLEPGDSAIFPLLGELFVFHGQQAQSGVTCGVQEISWLISVP